ncbi:MAG: hypothetical protein U1C74_23380, partial [Phenylobacterium sp.]|nr:hypothetical protein [Phenylobacterium sp.]
LKIQGGAARVRLVGWSGGGTMAAALAGSRDDVAGLVTFAAPLDVAGWTAAHDLSPLPLADAVRWLAATAPTVPQIHYLGEDDRTVDAAAGLATARRLGVPADVVKEAHDCCWSRRTAQAAARLGRPSP